MPAVVMLVVLAVAATCFYQAFVLLTVKERSTTVGRKTKERVLAMSTSQRKRKAVVMLVAGFAFLVLMVAFGFVLASQGISV